MREQLRGLPVSSRCELVEVVSTTPFDCRIRHIARLPHLADLRTPGLLVQRDPVVAVRELHACAGSVNAEVVAVLLLRGKRICPERGEELLANGVAERQRIAGRDTACKWWDRPLCLSRIRCWVVR